METNDPTNAEDAGQESSGQPGLPPPDYPAPPSQPLPPFGAWPPQPGMPVPPTYPDAGSYPAYPVYPPYPAPPGYANPPSGYLPYGPPPWGTPGWPGAPIPQSKPTSTGTIVAWVFGGILIAVLVICGGCVGLNVLAAGWFESAAITGANSPTVTPGPGFSALVPGPGCGTAGWDAPSTQSSSDVQCGTNSLLMKEPVTAQYLTEVDWTSPYAYANYSAWVTVGALSQGTCGGLGFQGAISYTGYVCANGTWYVVSYDSTGSPHQQAVGVTPIETSYQLETTVTASSLVFSIHSAQVATVALTGGGEVDAIVLDLYNDAGEDGSGTFSNFIYTPA